jgi:hypothetical protein
MKKTNEPMWWEQENTQCPDCGHLFYQHYPDCHRPCEDRLQAYEQAIDKVILITQEYEPHPVWGEVFRLLVKTRRKED